MKVLSVLSVFLSVFVFSTTVSSAAGSIRECNCATTWSPTTQPTTLPTGTPTGTPTDVPTESPFKTCTDPVDVVFVLDRSGSIPRDAYRRVRAFVARFVGDFSNATGFGIVEFATNTKVVLPLTHDPVKVEKSVRALRKRTAGWTNTWDALRMARNILELSFNRTSFVVLVTDGVPQAKGVPPKIAIPRVYAEIARFPNRTQIVPVAVGHTIGETFLNAVSRHHLYYRLGDYDSLMGILRSLQSYVC